MKTYRVGGKAVEYTHVVRIPMSDPFTTWMASICQDTVVDSDIGLINVVSYGPIEKIDGLNNFLLYAVQAPEEVPGEGMLYAYNYTEKFLADKQAMIDAIRVVTIEKEDKDENEHDE